MNRLLILLFLSVTGCNYNHAKGSGAPPIHNLEIVDYAVINASVIGPKCLSCHSTAGGNKGEVNLEGYENVRKHLKRIEIRSLDNLEKPMPPGQPLGPNESTLLRAWLEFGAPEKVTGPIEKGDPTLERGATDWSKIKDRIFASKCLACHSQPSPQKDLDLSSLPVVRANADKIFNRVIIIQDMPISPYPVLSPRERRVLLKWFDLGMPE